MQSTLLCLLRWGTCPTQIARYTKQTRCIHRPRYDEMPLTVKQGDVHVVRAALQCQHLSE